MVMMLLATALAALATAALASALEEGPTDGTHSLADARELGDGDTYSGHLQRATDRTDAFKVTAAQRTVVDVHMRIEGHDGTGEWTAPPRITPPAPPAAPYDSCMLDCYMYAGPSTTMAIDGAYNYYYVRDYSLSACAPVPGTAWYYIEVSLDWRWTPNDHVWDYTVEVRVSQPAEVVPGTSVTGTIDLDTRDTHWYSVRATQGSELWGDVEITNFDAAAPEARNVDIWAFPDDMGGYPRAMAWDWSAAPNEPVEPFSILATYDGLYYVKLRGMNHDLNLPCSYRLEVRVDPVPEFPAGGVTGAYLDRFRHDTDWYRFEMTANVPREGEPGLWNQARCFNLTERADSDELPDMDLFLFGLIPGGRALDLLDSSFRADHESFMSPVRDPTRNTEEVRAAAFYNGTYYLEVNDYNNTGFYDLVEHQWPWALSDHDDLPGEAHRVEAGTYESHIDQGLDHYDWYMGTAEMSIRAQFNSFKGTDEFNCSIYKRDEVSGRCVLLAGGWNVWYNVTSGQDQIQSVIDVRVDLAALGLGRGTYYVCVFAAVGADMGQDPSGRPFIYVIDRPAVADYSLRLWLDDASPDPQRPWVVEPIADLVVDEDTDAPATVELYGHFYDPNPGNKILRFKATVLSGRLGAVLIGEDTMGFKAADDYVGTVQVRVRALNRYFQYNDTLWNITFLPVNDAPRPKVAQPFRFPMREDTVASLDLATLFLEVDAGDALSFSIGQGAHVAIGLPPGSTVASLVPSQDWSGEEVVTVTATDSQGASTDLAVALAVEGVPDAPKLLRPLGEVEMLQDNLTTIPLDDYFVDPDGGVLSYSVTIDASVQASVDPATGILTLTPAHKWYGYRELSVTAVGSGGLTASGRIAVIVDPLERPPAIETSPPGHAVTLKEGGSMSFEVRIAEDAYPGPLIYEWRLDGRIMGVSWFYWLETGYDDAGVHALSVTVTDEQGASDSRTWTVTVEDVDRAPVGGIVSPPDGSSYAEGAEIPFVALVYDPDGGTVAYQWYVDAAVGGQEPSFEDALPVGDHNVRLVAGSGGAALEDSVNVTVEHAPAGGHWLAVGAVAALALTGASAAVHVTVRRRRDRGA
jgi:hypothetical protein